MVSQYNTTLIDATSVLSISRLTHWTGLSILKRCKSSLPISLSTKLTF